ncbi:tyrosine-type recombinase/integrase [bacterium]|nr:tyrosine-type recombinase/integrase [bacterium]
MPRKRELTWQAGAGDRPGRWKKIYKGRTVYCGTSSAKSDLEAYKKALEVWQEEKKRIDAEIASQPKPNQPDYEEAIRDWEKVLQWSQTHSDLANAALAREKIGKLQKRLESPSPPPLVYGDQFWDSFSLPETILEKIAMAISLPGLGSSPNPTSRSTVDPKALHGGRDIFVSDKQAKRDIWRDRLSIQEERPEEPENTVETYVNQFLEKERLRVEAKRLSASRFTSKRNNLFRFRDWIGSRTAIDAIDGAMIQAFHAELLRQIAAKTLAPDTAHGRLGDTKGFVRWLWRMNILNELPRVMEPGSNELHIGKRVASPEVFTIDEVKKLLTKATDRTKLYILLMLNAGMYQTDISNIRHAEVDWVAGTITRKRSKTKHHVTVPTVRYRLWEETIELLKKYRENSGEHVLLNKNGSPLVHRGLKPNGDPLTNDAIKNSIDRVRRKLSIKKPIKLFRKTSASLIRGNPEFRGLEDLFLGLSPRSISDRHYAKAPEDLLAEATDWLATQYGVK